jgi:D-3-phosphoglycerate dehydrogenase / 2-oxoglutarate reductase
MATNKKRVLITDSMSKAGIAVLTARDDIEVVPFPYIATGPDYVALLKSHDAVHATILGGTRFGEPELAAAKGLQVVARIGVGYDAIDIPLMTRHKIPVMIAGTANSPSVAEKAMTLMLTLAKRVGELDRMVGEGRWGDRFKVVPVDLFEKTVLVVGFGRIGTRSAKRCQAMEMKVLVYDPYVAAETIRAAGCEPVTDLDAAVARADFITIHCPKTKETVGLFDAARLAHMKPTAYIVNTARGGIIDEPALHAALMSGRIAGAGLDVLAKEPPDSDNPLLKLPNVIKAPHMAGVTTESMNRMGVQAARNVVSVFDGAPNRDNTVNSEIYG